MKILTCPFCGGIPKIIYRPIFKEHFVKCTNAPCQALVGYMGSNEQPLVCRTREEAVRRWNLTTPRTEVEAIERTMSSEEIRKTQPGQTNH